jgi:hypothetical protein
LASPRPAQEEAVPRTEHQIRQAIARIGVEIEELAWTVGRDQRKEARMRRRWTMLQAALGIVATVAARKLAARAYYLLTGEKPPHQRQLERPAPARRHDHAAAADEPTTRERAETAETLS